MLSEGLNLPVFFEEFVSLSRNTYYQMGGDARYFARPSSFSEVQTTLLFAREHELPCAILGSGSNVIFADSGFAGIVISLEHMCSWCWERPEILYVEAGVTNTEIAEICLAAERAGASWMFRMPGQIGGTIRMNARCYGGEISEIAESIITISSDGYLKTYSGKEIFRGYKSTLLMDTPEIVVAVRLHLPNKAAPEDLLNFMLQCERDRHSKHHFDFPSCGSTFKNNYSVGKPSGRIFDELGLKGLSEGNIQISPFHGNFLYNKGSASSLDMLTLAGKMRELALHSPLKADLELEVQPIGVFSSDMFEKCGMEKLGPSVITEENTRWVGMLWHKNLVADQTESGFPQIVMDSPFFSYHRAPGRGLTDIRCTLKQLMPITRARNAPTEPFLRWETSAEKNLHSNFFRFPENDGFTDELWHSSVSELFLKSSAPKGLYFEFEMTPKKHWIAIAFDGPRQRMNGHSLPQERHWPGVQTFVEMQHFGMEFTYNQLAPLLENSNTFNAQGALSLGYGRYFLAPHWKRGSASKTEAQTETWDEMNEPNVTADFHQPQRFWRVILK